MAVRRQASARAAGRGTSTRAGTGPPHSTVSTSPSSPTGPVRSMREVDGPSPSSMSAPTNHSNRRSRRSCEGEAGGPWAIFITTYDLDGGPHSAPYEVEVAGEHSSYRI